jgi:hypothetical protein
VITAQNGAPAGLPVHFELSALTKMLPRGSKWASSTSLSNGLCQPVTVDHALPSSIVQQFKLISCLRLQQHAQFMLHGLSAVFCTSSGLLFWIGWLAVCATLVACTVVPETRCESLAPEQVRELFPQAQVMWHDMLLAVVSNT